MYRVGHSQVSFGIVVAFSGNDSCDRPSTRSSARITTWLVHVTRRLALVLSKQVYGSDGELSHVSDLAINAS